MMTLLGRAHPCLCLGVDGETFIHVLSPLAMGCCLSVAPKCLFIICV